MKNVKVTVLITTYNRPNKVFNLTKSLKQMYPCTIIVVDDCTREKVDTTYIDVYVKQPYNRGKKGYWRTVNRLFRLGLREDTDYYIMLPDDADIDDNFINNAVSQWEKLNDEKKICLNLLKDHRKHCWTNFKRKSKGNYWLSQWVDMCFISDKRFLAETGIIRVSPNRWNNNKLLGSGVGQFISQKLYNKGWNMYQVKKTLVGHGDHESVMNSQARKINPIKS